MNRLCSSIVGLGVLCGGVAFAQAPAPAGPVVGMLGGPPPAPRTGPGKDREVARGPSIDLAYAAARAGVVACAGKHIGVAVIDQSGQPKLVYIPDGSSGANAAIAVRKANTALLLKSPSQDLTKRAAADKDLAAEATGNAAYIVWGGGLPILDHGEVIGAIGISGGGPEGIDEGCAQHGLDVIEHGPS